MSQIFVIPAEGMLVPDPAMRGSSDQVRLPPEGKFVEEGTYWHRRIRMGDVTLRVQPGPAVSPTEADITHPTDGDL